MDSPHPTKPTLPDHFPDPAQLSVFQVDTVMGFMASHPPLSRLPLEWESWEAVLDDAVEQRVQLGDRVGLREEDREKGRVWREKVKRLPVLLIDNLVRSKPLLRRAHLVLSYIQHFYLQSLPVDHLTILPRSISLPLLRVSAVLKIPPILTYSDTVLYNWRVEEPPHPAPTASTNSTPPPLTLPSKPPLSHLRSQTTFTRTQDEEEFYLCSARIELCGVEALDVMRSIMDEMFIADDIAVRRVTGYLIRLSTVIDALKGLLMDVKKRCDPDRYFNDVRPWFRGEDAADSVGYSAGGVGTGGPRRKWVFEGIEEDPELEQPTELSGPSAGQSSIIHVLDVFLGVDHESDPSSPSSNRRRQRQSFMTRMKTYMPYHHRLFIDHLASNPRPLRLFVLAGGSEELKKAYNQAVRALKGFRDAHMIIAALYILGPARRAAREKEGSELEEQKPLRGTGGTELVTFLKDTRARTVNAVIPE